MINFDFKLDTGSDVTIISPRLADINEKHILLRSCRSEVACSSEQEAGAKLFGVLFSL